MPVSVVESGLEGEELRQGHRAGLPWLTKTYTLGWVPWPMHISPSLNRLLIVHRVDDRETTNLSWGPSEAKEMGPWRG